MIKRITMTREQAEYAMSHGEFGEEIIQASSYVIVMMTQDWCPQWKKMNEWLYDLELDEEVIVFELVYNKESIFPAFRAFKEDVWHNYEIPYVRYYYKGKLINESNAVERKHFKIMLEL